MYNKCLRDAPEGPQFTAEECLCCGPRYHKTTAPLGQQQQKQQTKWLHLHLLQREGGDQRRRPCRHLSDQKK